MKISDFAQKTGVSADTVRYYERIGLLPRAGRDASGHRDYGEGDLVWMAFLQRLRKTGMSIRDMTRYAVLRDEGDTTLQARRDMLTAHRKTVRDQLTELRHSLTALDQKIRIYDAMIIQEKDPQND
ncbi:MAG: MerR family transcriptional regulator [Alphaproteobacteria bacterium]|nr:MerR family transcriptional regulator [Alphaproteobacteria bacterium]MBU2084751.1 MerR family transcriptional regulator [Alphaproteobacteria bacterium]MBU2144171.1 MerR family transcriptional regulator [Alphaproteobacteria bacterium]MBU2198286.1 MerR family transcriptional regulator [Alphaproteobacteria bacterium]